MIRYLPATTIFCSLILLLAFCGCVSVNLAQSGSPKADKIDFHAPTDPFQVIKTDSADRAWQSNISGNTLAYLSECNQNTDTHLRTLETDALNALTDLKILKSNQQIFDGRDSIETLAEGKVDGVPVKVSLLTFQKNGCNFSISFTGRKQNFDSETIFFERFKESFRVP
jgi:hypothetical protein